MHRCEHDSSSIITLRRASCSSNKMEGVEGVYCGACSLGGSEVVEYNIASIV